MTLSIKNFNNLKSFSLGISSAFVEAVFPAEF
jgi:hypothetical protein